MRIAKLIFASLVASIAMAHAAVRAAGEETSAFDGLWEVTLTCPAHHEDEDAKGYVHRFPAEVKGGNLRGTHGKEGQPSWHLLTGSITPAGTAALTLEGIVSNPDYAINNAQRGKRYTYRVRATFEATSGNGQRLGKRRCDFRFKRQ